MPSELRCLLFHPNEVLQAVKEYQHRRGIPLTEGAVVQACSQGDSSDHRMRFRIRFAFSKASRLQLEPGEQRMLELIVEMSALAAALIYYCRNLRVPLPASVEKSLHLVNGQVALVLRINPDNSAMPDLSQLTQSRSDGVSIHSVI